MITPKLESTAPVVDQTGHHTELREEEAWLPFDLAPGSLLQLTMLECQMRYWCRHFDRERVVLADPVGSVVQGHGGATRRFVVEKKTKEQLRGVSCREEVALFMILRALFQALLWHYSARHDTCRGIPSANRWRAELKRLVRVFVDTLVLCADFSAEPTFGVLPGRVPGVALGAQAHRYLRREWLIGELQPVRDRNGRTLFQVVFALQNATTGKMALLVLREEPVAMEGETKKCNFGPVLVEGGAGLSTPIECLTTLYDAGSIGKLAGHYCILLDRIATHHESRVRDLYTLREEEGCCLLKAMAGNFPNDRCLHMLFEKQIACAFEAVAGVCEHLYLRYAELSGRGNQPVPNWRSLDVGLDGSVGLYVERSLNMVVGLLGIPKPGGTSIPLNPAFPRESLAHMVQYYEALLISMHADPLEVLTDETPTQRLDADWPSLSGWSRGNPIVLTWSANVVRSIYVSGSMRRPKMIVVTAQNVRLRFAVTEDECGITAADVLTLFESYAVDFFLREAWRVWGRLLIVLYWICRAPKPLHEFMRKRSVTLVDQTPESFYQLGAVYVTLLRVARGDAARATGSPVGHPTG